MTQRVMATRASMDRARLSYTKAIADGYDSLALGLYFFASTHSYEPSSYYDFVLEAATFADRHRLTSVWLPERHFVSFGGFSPNPVVLASAIAARTKHVHIRAGSVAAPLHHPVRIAEEWAMLDNLSKGRIGLSFASGWHQNDFVLAREPHAVRKEVMSRHIRDVRALWAGEAVEYDDPDGTTHAVKLSPRPVLESLPLWITAAGNPETFELAGRSGVGVMCALFNTSLRQLGRKIERYRAAWKETGHPGRGHVVVMVHAFVSDDAAALERLRPAMRDYLIFFGSQTPTNAAESEVLEAAVDSYFEGASLLGSTDRARHIMSELVSADFDEVGALIDFGLPGDIVLDNLPNLYRVHSEVNTPKRGG